MKCIFFVSGLVPASWVWFSRVGKRPARSSGLSAPTRPGAGEQVFSALLDPGATAEHLDLRHIGVALLCQARSGGDRRRGFAVVMEIGPAAGTTRPVGDEFPGVGEYESVTAASDGRLYATPACTS